MAAERKGKLTLGESKKAVRDSLVLEKKNLKKTLEAVEKEKQSHLNDMNIREKKLRRSMQVLALEREKIASNTYTTRENNSQIESISLPHIGKKCKGQNERTDTDINSGVKTNEKEEKLFCSDVKTEDHKDDISPTADGEKIDSLQAGNAVEEKPRRERKTGRVETEKAFLLNNELSFLPKQELLSPKVTRSRSSSLLSEKEMQEVNKVVCQRKNSYTNNSQVGGNQLRKLSPHRRIAGLQESRPRAESDEVGRRICSHVPPRYLDTREKMDVRKISLGSYSSPRASRKFLYHSPQVERKVFLKKHISDEEFEELKKCRYLRFSKEQEKEFQPYYGL